MINVSTTAASKINELLAEEGKAGSGLRVFVQGGGCSGFQYGLMIEESGGVGDQVFESNGVRLFVDPVSISYLKGAEVDFVDTVTGGGFTIQNPNATSTCGCGSSFSVDGEGGGGGTITKEGVPTRPRISVATALPDLSRLKPTAASAPASASRSSTCSCARKGTSAPTISSISSASEDQRISRATVYRTLQWMVDAGIARKVDFGEGRFRFEHSYRQPRHFHLICKTCHRSFEFLSSDIEVLVEEVATARGFTASQSVVQIYGTCEECRTGRARPPAATATPTCVFARDALRIAIATERSGLEFYTRAARVTRDARGRKVFQRPRARGEGAPRQARGALRRAAAARSAARVAADVPVLQGRGQRPVRRGRRAAARRRQRSAGADDRHPLRARLAPLLQEVRRAFEDSEGKQIFLEFADEEREHLDLLVREYRALVKRQGRQRRPRPVPTSSPRAGAR